MQPVFIHSSNAASVHELQKRMLKISASAGQLRSKLRERLDEVQAQVEFLVLVQSALLEELESKGLTTLEAVKARMDQLDGEDGEVDRRRPAEALRASLGAEPVTVNNQAEMRESLNRLAEKHRSRARIKRSS